MEKPLLRRGQSSRCGHLTEKLESPRLVKSHMAMCSGTRLLGGLHTEKDNGMTASSEVRDKGILLTVYLVYITLSNAWWAYRAFDRYWLLVSHSATNVPHWPYLVLGIVSVAAAAGVAAIWFWKRWGVFLYLLCWASAIGMNAFLGAPAWSYLLSIANVALLYAFLRPKWALLQP